MIKNVFSGVPVCHDFKGVLKGKMRTGIWVTWTKIVGGGGGGGGLGGGEIGPPTFEGKIETIVGVCSSNSLATR